MQRFAFGLDISDRSAELVSLLTMKGSVAVDRYGRVEIPPGVINQGVIGDPDKLVLVLSSFLDEFIGPRRTRIPVGVCLPESQTYCRVFTLPANLNPDLSRKAINIEAVDRLPIPLAGAATDSHILSEREGSRDYFFCAADKTVLDAYRQVIERAGMEPQFFDSEALALCRAVINPRDAEPALVADIGARTTALHIWDRGGVRLATSVPLGGDNLSSAIEIHLNIPLEKADKIKNQDGFDPGAEDGRTMLILQRPMAEILDEIRRTADYYENRTGRRPRELVLAGGTALVPFISEYVSSNLTGLRVTVGQPLRGLAVDHLVNADKFKKISIIYAAAIGLALRAAGVRVGAAVNLASGIGESRGAAAFRRIRSAVTSLFSMVTRKTSHKKKTAKRPEPAEETLVLPAVPPPAEPEPPMMPEPPVEPPKLQTSPPIEHSLTASVRPETGPEISDDVAAVLPEPPAAVAPEPELPVEDEVEMEMPDEKEDGSGDDFGQNIGDILGTAYDEKTTESGDSAPGGEDIGPTKPSNERMAIKSILERAKQRSEVAAVPGARNGWLVTALLAVLVMVFLVLAVGGAIFFVRKNGLLDMWGKKAPETAGTVPGEPVKPAPVASVSVLAAVGLKQQPPGDKPFILGRAIETDASASDSFLATGEIQATQGKAKGTITIHNNTPKDYTFVATTRFLTPEGVLFRMDKTSAIAANETTDVAVTADKVGPGGDIGPSSFTIPGLPKDLQSQIFGSSENAMTGGGGTAKAVSAADLEAAKAKLAAKLKAEADKDFGAMLAAGEKLLPELITSSEVAFTAPKADTAMSGFTAKLTLRFRAMVLPEASASALLLDKMKQQLPAGAIVTDYSLGSTQYIVEAYETSTDRAQIRLEAAIRKQ
ncbi:hypothetical protein A3C96_00980 [Candidatus Uhrbacteria bacterium RIFCSPHIGHO2_02_FULL_60_10]|uniref:SHS2 domain-containing protein n=1 Tax=Candidatus Uhrbacteria bacterium RIFCSPHIGHO2_02_FULL_60_10 TaxID=1802392 RepID=A0A1F7U4E2_9BACT|nr:MAG: hypothetical protein A3C96_00980 [Candidatus Uhrbacteria bacterium RIFCSPHIGHO2_02_FULL_60_10]